MCYKGVIEGKIGQEGKMSFSIFIFIYTIHLAYLKVYTKFENTGSNRSPEICERNFHWRERKNEQIKGLICHMWLFFLLHNTTHHYQACTKFQNPKSSSCSEIFDRKKMSIVLLRVTEGKNENLKKEGKLKISILMFIYTIHFAYLKVYTKLKNTCYNRS